MTNTFGLSNRIKLSASRNHFSEYFLVVAITLIAAALRFYKLGEWSFWGDEIFTIGSKEDGFNFDLFRLSLSTVMIHRTTGWLGVNEWTARLFPALVGILSIPILYFLVKRLFGSPIALFAGLLLALSPWHLYWSQNARFYPLLLLFYSIGLFLFLTGLEEDKSAVLFLALLFFGLAARERLLALFFLPVVTSHLLLVKLLPVEKPKGFNLRNLAVFFIPGIVLMLLFAWPYLGNLRGWLVSFNQVDNTPFWVVGGALYYIGLPVVFPGAFGAIYSFSRLPRQTLFFLLAAVLPLLIIFSISPFHYTGNRYAFITLTSWIILACLSVRDLFTLLPSRAKSIAIGLALLMIVTSLGEVTLYFIDQNGNRGNYKDAYAYVQDRWSNADLVISGSPAVGQYYLGKEPLGFQYLEPATLNLYNRIWIVMDNIAEFQHPEKASWLETHTQQVANYDVHVSARTFKMRVYLYERK